MESSSRTLVCSVLFLDIAEYSKKAVADQLQLKQAFNLVLSKALEEVPPRDRIILDTGDGAAVTFMGDPEDALFAAMSVRDMSATLSSTGALAGHSGGLPVRLGVNLGPVRLVKDLNGQMNIIGDGINVAQRVMSFSRPGQLLVSRSFYEVVSCLSRDYLTLFRHEGSRTDKHVREHEVYSVGGAPAARRVAESASQVSGGSRVSGWLAGSGPLGLRRSALVAAPTAFLFLVGSSVALSALFEPASATQASAPPATVQKKAAPPAETPRTALADVPKPPASANSGAAVETAKPVTVLPRKAEKKAERLAAIAAQPGKLELAITPWGKVLIDGQERGLSPPLRVVAIPPGAHTIVIQNANFPPHVERIVIRSGESAKIRHRFK
jgi:class 3 adenylate cyclase